MNIFLWILQILLALHTVIGALWKLSNSQQAVPSLKAIPPAAWRGMSAIELLCSLGLILPAFYGPSFFISAATTIAAEMLLFCLVHGVSGHRTFGPVSYWLVVAAVSGFIAYRMPQTNMNNPYWKLKMRLSQL